MVTRTRIKKPPSVPGWRLYLYPFSDQPTPFSDGLGSLRDNNPCFVCVRTRFLTVDPYPFRNTMMLFENGCQYPSVIVIHPA